MCWLPVRNWEDWRMEMQTWQWQIEISFDQFISPVIELVFLQICEHQDREAAMVILNLIFLADQKLFRNLHLVSVSGFFSQQPCKILSHNLCPSCCRNAALSTACKTWKERTEERDSAVQYGTLKASTVFMIVTDPPRGILFQEVVASFPRDESSNASHSTLNRGWQGTNNWSIFGRISNHQAGHICMNEGWWQKLIMWVMKMTWGQLWANILQM